MSENSGHNLLTGVMVMVHGDDKGLVLPPNTACYQVRSYIFEVGNHLLKGVFFSFLDFFKFLRLLLCRVVSMLM